jgi:hypothetical protein
MSSPLSLYFPYADQSIIEKDKARKLLDKQINISYCNDGGGAGSTQASVCEIFLRVQHALFQNYPGASLVIKGSSVASIFSDEPVHDIDFRSVIDLTSFPERERVKRGYDIKWLVLRKIHELIAEKNHSSIKENQQEISRIERLDFSEENFLLSSTRAKAFNVHRLSFGEAPIDLSVICIVKEIEESERNFCFNCSALELTLSDGLDATVHSYMPDLSLTIDDISLRQISAYRPEDIKEKSIVRYFSKLFVSGYFDPDAKLWDALAATHIAAHRPKEISSIADDLVLELKAYIKKKDIVQPAIFLALWLLRGDCQLQKSLSIKAKDTLITIFQRYNTPFSHQILALVESRMKAEICYLLLCHALSLRVVSHRGDASLQVEVPIYPFFSSSPSSKSMSFILSKHLFLQIDRCACPQLFFPNCEPFTKDLTPETKRVLQELFSKKLFTSELFPIFFQLVHHFDLKINSTFSKLFIEWFSSLSKSERKEVPFSFVHKGLIHAKEEMIDGSLFLHDMLEKLSAGLSDKEIYSLALSFKEPLYPLICFHLLKDERISHEEYSHIIRVCRILLTHFFQDIDAASSFSDNLRKKMLNLLHICYVKKEVGADLIIQGSKLCLHMGSLDHTLKILHIMMKTDIDQDRANKILHFFENAKQMPKALIIRFICQNQDVFHHDRSSIVTFWQKLYLESIEGAEEDLLKSLLQMAYEIFPKKLLLDIDRQMLVASASGCKLSRRGVLASEMVWHLDWEDRLSSTFAPAVIQDLLQYPSFITCLENEPNTTERYAKYCLDMGIYSTAERWVQLFCQKDFSFGKEHLFYLKDKVVANRDLALHYFSLFLDLARIHKEGVFPSSLLLDSCDSLLYLYDKETEKAYKEQFFDFGRLLHRHIYLDTMDHPLWRMVCGEAKKRGVNLDIQHWIDHQVLSKKIHDISLFHHLPSIIETFTLDLSFVCSLMNALTTLQVEERESFFPLIIHILEKGTPDLWNAFPDEPLSSESAASMMHYIIFPIIARQLHVPSREGIFIALNGMLFCSMFGDALLRFSTLASLFDIMNSKDNLPVIVETFILSGKIDRIFFCCVEKALKERNLDELKALSTLYIERISTEMRLHTLSRRDNSLLTIHSDVVKRRCDLWSCAINDWLRDPCVFENSLVAPSLEINATEFFIKFLKDMLISLEGELPQIEGQAAIARGDAQVVQDLYHASANLKVVTGKLLSMIDFLTKKKRIETVLSLSHIAHDAKKLPHKLTRSITEKMIAYASESLMHSSKKQKNPDSWILTLECLNYSLIMITQCEKRGERIIDRSIILRLLDSAKAAICQFSSEQVSSEDCIFVLSFLEGTLNIAETIEYHGAWARSIIERKHTVTFEELSLFSFYTLRLDPKISSAIDERTNRQMFADKLFINQKYFSHAKNIEALLQIFDIGFSRFFSHIAAEDGEDGYNNIDIFTLYSIYCQQIQSGIVHLHTASDVHRLQNLFVDIHERPLLGPRNRLTLSFCRLTWNLLIYKRGPQDLAIRFPSKDATGRYIQIFYSIISILASTPSQKLNGVLTSPEPLCIAYENHKALFRKHLTKDQIAKIEAYFDHHRQVNSMREVLAILQSAVKK